MHYIRVPVAASAGAFRAKRSSRSRRAFCQSEYVLAQGHKSMFDCGIRKPLARLPCLLAMPKQKNKQCSSELKSSIKVHLKLHAPEATSSLIVHTGGYIFVFD